MSPDATQATAPDRSSTVDGMRVRHLDHIVLNVVDVERSLAWYTDLLGLAPERVDEWRAGTVPFPSVRIDEGCIIDLFAAERTGENLNHVCLVVEPGDVVPPTSG